MANKTKILITAGGGGHFSPALAVISKLPKEEVLFVGRKYAFEGDSALSLEYKTVQEKSIPFRTITAGRLPRALTLRSIASLVKIPVGFYQAFRIVHQVRPAIVVSFGGYIALPVTVAAFILRIPVIIHEQTMGAGLANKITGKFAEIICITFPSSKRFFPEGKTLLTGNPLREEMLAPAGSTRYFEEKLPVIFITGGSLGSHAINRMIEEILEKLTEKYQVLHQTGDAQEFKDFERLEKKRDALSEKAKKRYIVRRFITPYEMRTMLQQASLVVARSGINTVLELLYFHKPALLIPLPHGQKNEQLENARFLEDAGLARVKIQEELTSQTMYTEIERMIEELSSFQVKPEFSPSIQKDAAEKIVSAILSYTEKLPSQASEEEKKR